MEYSLSKHRTAEDAAQTMLDALRDPMGFIHERLTSTPLDAMSSLRLGELTGVPASNFRAIRKGVPADMLTSNWSTIVLWLLAYDMYIGEKPNKNRAA